MSLLAGIKIVKRAPSAPAEQAARNRDLGSEGGQRLEECEDKQPKRKKHKKDRKKEKTRPHHDKTSDRDAAGELFSKRRKSQDNIVKSGEAGSTAGSDGRDWLDEALNVGASKTDSEGKYKHEAPEGRKHQEEIEDKVPDGRQDDNSKPRYGLHDPRKGDHERVSTRGNALELTPEGSKRIAGGRTGVTPMAAPRLIAGIGDKGAGWRAKALKRAREKAEQTGKSLQEVVEERWGSLGQLKRETQAVARRGFDERRRKGRGNDFYRGRDELRALADGDDRISPGDSTGLLGKVGQSEERWRPGRDERGGRGGRLRIGRDARDTDVLKRFSSKLEDALGRNKETSRHRDEGRDQRFHDSGRDYGPRDRQDNADSDEGRMGWREREARATGHGERREKSRDDRRIRREERGSGSRDEGGRRDRDRYRKEYDSTRAKKREQREPLDMSQGQDHGVRDDRREYRDRSRDSPPSPNSVASESRDGMKSPERGPDAAEYRTTGTADLCDKRAGVKSHADGGREGRETGRHGDGEEKEEKEGARDLKIKHGQKPDRKVGLEQETPVERSAPEGECEGKAGPDSPAVMLMSEAEITKLTVAAMKAKLKGDKATYERLMGQVRAGREAAAKVSSSALAETAVAGTNMTNVRSPSTPFKPGQIEDQGKRGRSSAGSKIHAGGSRTEKGDEKGRELQQQEQQQQQQQREDEDEEVEVVTLVDERGRPVSSNFAKTPLMREDLRQGARKGKLKAARGGWAENTGESVADFVRREREQGFEDMDETFVRNVSRLGNKFKGTEMGGTQSGLADEDEDVDMRMFQRPEDRMTAIAAAERQRSRAIREHKRHSDLTSRCHLCVDSPVFKKRLMLSLGEHTYLYLATGTHRLSEGHCYIVPIRHTPASTACDEDVWREIDLFKAALRRMAASADSDPKARMSDKTSSTRDKKTTKASVDEAQPGGVIFLETGGREGSSAAKHAFIEAVPVKRSAFLDAPLYFRQAIMEAGEEWSTHKKCITADPRRGGVRRAVPKGFPYFHVEWDDGGYAHVIEGEEAKFPRNFGVDTLAGVLGVEPPSFGGRSRVGSARGGGGGVREEEDERKMVLSFLDRWKAFDWTSRLDGGEYQESGASHGMEDG